MSVFSTLIGYFSKVKLKDSFLLYYQFCNFAEKGHSIFGFEMAVRDTVRYDVRSSL